MSPGGAGREPDKIRRRVLDFANEVREAAGLPPAQKLLPGIAGQIYDCPLGNTIGERTDLARYSLRSLRVSTSPPLATLRVYTSSTAFYEVTKEMPDYVEEFLAEFDSGKYTDLHRDHRKKDG